MTTPLIVTKISLSYYKLQMLKSKKYKLVSLKESLLRIHRKCLRPTCKGALMAKNPPANADVGEVGSTLGGKVP